MYLYHLTLQKPTAITHSVAGSFSEANVNELILVRGRILELVRFDTTSSDKLTTIFSVEIFGVIRTINTIKIAEKDYIITTSDSGKINIIEYDKEKKKFITRCEEWLGPSGCRRLIPGQYAAINSNQKIIMVASIQNQKCIYFYNSSFQLTKVGEVCDRSICFGITSVEIGNGKSQNPIFASIEVIEGEAASKYLVFYEVDLNDNNTIHKTQEKIDISANLLISIPGNDKNSPGGVLVCAENVISWRSYSQNSKYTPKVNIPMRKNTNRSIPPQNAIIISSTVVYNNDNNNSNNTSFYILLQSEFGDLFKVDLEVGRSHHVENLKISYYDSLPISNSLTFIRPSYLFVAAETGNHNLYQFLSSNQYNDDVEEEEEDVEEEEKEDGGNKSDDDDDNEKHINYKDDDDATDSDNDHLQITHHHKKESSNNHNMELEDSASSFLPHKLKHFKVIERLESLTPILSFQVKDIINEQSPQIYALSGASSSSSLRVLRQGLEISEVANSPLPFSNTPTGIWAIKRNASDQFDSLLIISTSDSTMVLKINENGFENTTAELNLHGIITTSQTLNIKQIGSNAIIQIIPTAIRYIMGDMKVQEWRTPGKKLIARSAIQHNQIVISLSGGEIYYFIAHQNGQLIEEAKKEIGHEISCLDISPSYPNNVSTTINDDDNEDDDDENRMMISNTEGKSSSSASRLPTSSRFLAVGDWDGTVRILSLSSENYLQTVSMQSLPSQPISLCLVDMQNEGNEETFFLNIGLHDGVLLRLVIDQHTGELSDVRRRFLGLSPVKLYPIYIKGKKGMIALSSRAWVHYNYQSKLFMTSLSTTAPFECATHFSSKRFPEAIATIIHNTLRIVTIEHLADTFNQTSIPLKYTPRKFVIDPPTNHLVVIETEHNSSPTAYPNLPSHSLHRYIKKNNKKRGNDDDDDDDEQKKSSPEVPHVTATRATWKIDQQIRRKRRGDGKWVSCLTLLDAKQLHIEDSFEFKMNEAAFSICHCQFSGHSSNHIIVGTVKNMSLSPRSVTCGYLYVFQVVPNIEDGKNENDDDDDMNNDDDDNEEKKQPTSYRLKFIHRTEVEELPGALCSFDGRLLAAIGNTLRIYDLGKTRLIRKCENVEFPNLIKSVHALNDHIIVGDITESFSFVKYQMYENRLVIFAKDATPRSITATCMLDVDTVAGGDKFGNAFICRLPKEINEIPSYPPFTTTPNFLNGKHKQRNLHCHKIGEIIQFHVGEPITALYKVSLIKGGAEVLLYATAHGAIGVFFPFVTRDEVEFFSQLETQMRISSPPLCGRDHLQYRSYYSPVKNVIDGDLCEQFIILDIKKREQISHSLEKKPYEIMKKLEDMRNRCL